jgi:hypothetical protein
MQGQTHCTRGRRSLRIPQFTAPRPPLPAPVRSEFPSPRLHTSLLPLHSHPAPAWLPPRPPPTPGPSSLAAMPPAAAAAFLSPAVAVSSRALPLRRARHLAVRAVASPPASKAKPAPPPSKVRSPGLYSCSSNVLYMGSGFGRIELTEIAELGVR